VDWITSFLSHTKDINSPEIFRLWSGITTMAISMERRCWTQTRHGVLYPNLFTMLVSSPGIGKTEAIKRSQEVLSLADKFAMTPHSMTRAALIDALRFADKTMLGKDGAPLSYHSLALIVDELGVMIAAHDLEFLSVLNELYDTKPSYKERRRHFNEGKEILIERPQLNILAGSQPAFLAHLLPEEAWGMGFTSRMLLIYAGMGAEHMDVFGEFEEAADAAPELAIGLARISEKSGAFIWSPTAQGIFNAWKKRKCEPVPEHSKLVHYLPRRHINAIKLAMVSAISRTGELRVEEDDIIRGLDWLLAAEAVMPDIFREMAGKSDSDVLMELHYFMWAAMTRLRGQKKEANIPESEMYNFLRMRVPGEKILRILEVAERSKIISRDPQNMARWIARPKHMHGVE